MDEDFVLEVGKVTMARAALEEAVYVVAQDAALGIDKPIREISGTRAAERVRDQARQGPFPPWVGSDLTQESVADWASAAKGALTDAHKIVHSRTVARPSGQDEGWTTIREQTGAKGGESASDLPTLVRLRERLDGLASEGSNLRIGLLPMMAHSLYAPYFSAETATIVSVYDGAWYHVPGTLEEANQMAELTREWCTSILERHPTPSLQVSSPHGDRMVPPSFAESVPEDHASRV